VFSRRPRVLAAALFVLFAGANHARAGYISSDHLEPFANAAMLDGSSAAPAGSGAYFTNPDQPSPDGPRPSGIFGGFSRSPVCPFQRPSSSRTPRYSGTGPVGGLSGAATVLADIQLVIHLRTVSTVIALYSPIDSIFKPPRVFS
jgi:hypothetical protein